MRLSAAAHRLGPATAEKDLAKLVLSLVDLVRQLMERQAIRRINAGSVSEEEVEQWANLPQARQRMMELRTAFGLGGTST